MPHGVDFIGVPLDREPGDLINDSKRSFFSFFSLSLSLSPFVPTFEKERRRLRLINMRAYTYGFETLKKSKETCIIS